MDTGYQIVTVQSHKQLGDLLNKGLRKTYQECFGAEPWGEFWRDDEVDSDLHDYLDHQDCQFYVAITGDKAVGLGVGFPIRFHRDVAKHLSTHPSLELDTVMYMADVAVHPDHQRHGLGSAMIDMRLQNLPLWCQSVVMRTAKEGSHSQPLYVLRNFELLEGWDMMVSSRRLNGRIAEDPRVFLHCLVENIRFPSLVSA